MAEIARWVRHNQGIFVSLVLSAGVLIWTFGCESKVTSLVDPTKMVTAAELNLEIDTETRRLEAELDLLLKRAELKQVELRRAQEIRQKLMDFALLSTEAGTLNPSGMIGLVAGVLGVGAAIDNRIKDKVIKNRPLPVKVKPAAEVTS